MLRMNKNQAIGKMFNLNTLLICALMFFITSQSIKAAETTQSEAQSAAKLEQVSNQSPVKATTDIVISSLEEESLTSGKSTSERHHYDQQQSAQEPQASETKQPTSSEVETDVSNLKPEPRNQDDQANQDSMFIDHRPQNGQVEQTQLSSLGQDFSQTGQQSVQTSTVASINIPQATPPAQNQWNSQPIPQQSYQSSSKNQQNSGGNGAQTSASNPIGSIQHPNSINAIIGEHQNSQQLSVQQPQQINLATGNNNPVAMTVNGQPMVLMNSAQASGRKTISLSGWLKGISSILANIFNRRDHGGLIASPSNTGFGHWIQLGPNAPHWLSQAQAAIQSQQQVFQQQFNPNPIGAASTRYATYVPASQQQSQISTAPNQQTQPTMTITLQPAALLAANQPSSGYQSNLDLQQSASSTSFIQVQPPNQPQVSQPAYQAPTLNTQQSPIGGAIQVSLVQAAPVGVQQQSVTRPSNNDHLRQTAFNGQQQQQQQQYQANPNQSNSASWQQASSTTNSQPTQTRFSRSSTLVSSNSNLPLAHYSRFEGTQVID